MAGTYDESKLFLVPSVGDGLAATLALSACLGSRLSMEYFFWICLNQYYCANIKKYKKRQKARSVPPNLTKLWNSGAILPGRPRFREFRGRVGFCLRLHTGGCGEDSLHECCWLWPGLSRHHAHRLQYPSLHGCVESHLFVFLFILFCRDLHVDIGDARNMVTECYRCILRRWRFPGPIQGLPADRLSQIDLVPFSESERLTLRPMRLFQCDRW